MIRNPGALHKRPGAAILSDVSANVQELPDGSATTPQGFTAAAAAAGLKPGGALDVALLVSATSCATAGVFTKNAVRAAPVLYDQDLLLERPGRVRAVAMNARVANACTGADGLAAARAMAQAAEQAAGLPPRTALVLSTGVIGVPLPLEQVATGLREAAAHLAPDGGLAAARAIMTTDTRPKHCAAASTPRGARSPSAASRRARG
jgi:glutamate N-acetyltransferase/amino-acid N-acetyltransferase